jgi:hypothetical protein
MPVLMTEITKTTLGVTATLDLLRKEALASHDEVKRIEVAKAQQQLGKPPMRMIRQ